MSGNHKSLGELFTFKNGRSFKKAEWKTSGLPIIRIQNLNDRDATFNYFDGEYSHDILVESGDLLFSWSGTIGTSFGSHIWDREPGVLNQHIFKVGMGPDVDSRYAFHTLRYITTAIEQSVNGSVGLVHITKEKLNQFTIPLPPLPEQQRIVGILDEAFAGIATAKTNAEKNLRNARELFESYLESAFIERGASWDRVTLQTLLDRGWIEGHLDGNHGGDYPRKSEFVSAGVPYISANCIDDAQVDMSCAKYLSPERAAKLRKGIAKDRDVLFAHNATVGPVALLRTTEEKVILGTSLTYYRCSVKHILPEYLAHYMRSFAFTSQYSQVMRQSTRNQVPITKQREFFHVIPPVEEQERMIGTLDRLLESGRHLESLYQKKLAALDALKKSLLHQAFSGMLTANRGEARREMVEA